MAYSDLLQVLTAHNGGTSILPALRQIHWLGRIPSDPSILIPFFSASLRQAYFFFEEIDNAHLQVAMLLRGLRHASPLLDSITINSDEGDTVTANSESSLVKELVAFDHLRSVTIGHLSDFSTFRNLVTKSSITSICILDVTGTWVGCSQPIPLHNLCELSIEGKLAPLASLLKSVRFHALKTVHIHTVLPGETELAAGGAISLLVPLSAAVSSSGFQELKLSFESSDFHDGHHRPATGAALSDLIAPILPLRDVRSFSFFTPNTMYWSVSHADIDVLARAWPKLEFLHLEGADVSSPVPTSTLHRLYLDCPDLRELTLPSLSCPVVGVHAVPAPSPDRPPHKLKRFSVQRCVPVHGPDFSDAEAEGLARYILDLFPLLNTEGYSRELRLWDEARVSFSDVLSVPLPLTIEACWEKVMRLMCSMRAQKGLS